MICFEVSDTRFQLRAAAIVVHTGRVLLHRAEHDSFWALPGGRVEPGETGAATIVREMKEELDQTLECDELLYLAENFFAYEARHHHEIGMYFRARLCPNSALLRSGGPFYGIEGHTRLIFAWFDIAHLGDVDLRPAFLRKALAEPTLSFKHVVQHG